MTDHRSQEIELAAGTIEYEDTGGNGPVLVLTHGLVMDASLWRNVVADLRSDYRCVVPTLPLGAHRNPMREDADLSMTGIAGILSEFLERLDLGDVTLVVSDWGGPLLLASNGASSRIARLVLTSCEAFDNVPPGLPGHMVSLAAKLPGGINGALQPMRFRPLRRSPIALGLMTKRRIPHEVTDAWLEPALSQRAIRRDLRKYASSAREGSRELAAGTARLAEFDRPALIAWAAEDRVMPRDHGRKLAELMPNARLVEIPDSRTLIPEDQPALLAREIRAFLEQTA
jgi:pimeloyl-ACP methyl ester carboxylesterase